MRAVPHWAPVTGSQLGLIACLGVGANFLLHLGTRRKRHGKVSSGVAVRCCPASYCKLERFGMFDVYIAAIQLDDVAIFDVYISIYF